MQKETATQMEMEKSWQQSPFLAKKNRKNNCVLHRNVFCLVFIFIYSLLTVVRKV